MLALLRSSARRVLGGMVLELRYTGRRTGREYTLPVEYARTADGVVICPQRPDRTAWWRNFHTPAPVTLRIAGRLQRGTARLVQPDDPLWELARRRYAAHWWQPWRRPSGPLVIIEPR